MNLKLWIGVVVSVAFLAVSLRGVDWEQAWQSAQRMNPWYLAPYMALIVAEVMLRAWKWQLLLAPVQRCSFRNLNSATLIGLMANNVLPMRLGEFVRAYVGSQMERIPFSTSFATVAIDRITDGLTVSLLFIAAILFYPLLFPQLDPLDDRLKAAGYAAGAIYVVALAFLGALIVWEKATVRLLATILRPFPTRLSDGVLALVNTFLAGIDVLRKPILLLAIEAITIVVWLGYAASLYLMALAFGIELPFVAFFLVLVLLTIALTAPSTPGFIGTMEAGVTAGLQLFGVDPSAAFAFAVVYHVTQYVPITVGGFVALWVEGLTMSDITRMGQK
ncbi:MAG: putative rane protein [Chloroflexi bacterium]|nr:putative rane protein [Chloroflexota bacterium]